MADRPPRRDRGGDERPRRNQRPGGPPGGRPRRPDFNRPRGDFQPPRRDDSDRPRRDDADRPGRQDFDRPRRDFDRPRRDFERPRRDFDRPRRDFDRPRRHDADPPRRGDFDRPRRDFDRPRPPEFDRPRRDQADRPRREEFDRPRRDFDRPRTPEFDRPRRGDSERPRREAFDRPRFERRDRPADRPFDRNRDRPPGRPSDHPRFDRPQPVRPRPALGPDSTAELVGADDEMIAGRHPVQEAFAAKRDAVRLLVVPERREALDNLVIHATTLRIPVVEVEGGTLTSLAGFDGHQGVALVAHRRPAATLDDILGLARARGQPPLVLVLDSLEDPQNLGTLLRSAEATGVHGVIYPERRAVPLTAAAIKAAAGATEHLLLAPVADLYGTLADLRSLGLRTIGADQQAALTYSQADLRGPLALVVGSEGFGISGQLRRRLDQTVRIPMRGKVASLNAAVAGSVLLFAAAEQRGEAVMEPAPVEPPPEEPASEPDPQTSGAEASEAAESVPELPAADLLPDDSATESSD